MSRAQFEKNLKEKADLEDAVNELIKDISTKDNIISDLKKAKDKIEVENVEKKYKDVNKMEEFENMASKISRLLNSHSSVVRGIIFNDYFDKNITIDTKFYKSDIDEAVAENQIDGEDITVNWGNRSMTKIRESFDEFRFLMDRLSADTEFTDEFDEKYDCDFEFDNRTFFQNVFATNIAF